MGSSGFKSEEKQVESTSLTELFEKMCPIYMSYGMTYDEYWKESPYRAKFYREAHELKVKQNDEEMWVQGMYIYEALCKVSPVLHAFSKSGTKPLPYSSKPYLYDVKTESERDKEREEKEKQQQIENERLIAQVHFSNWARATAKMFNKKENNEK